MSCEYCGKPVKHLEDFILVGKYPTRGQIWNWSKAKNYAKPENYGKYITKNASLQL
jgi:hypothetical protein